MNSRSIIALNYTDLRSDNNCTLNLTKKKKGREFVGLRISGYLYLTEFVFMLQALIVNITITNKRFGK